MPNSGSAAVDAHFVPKRNLKIPILWIAGTPETPMYNEMSTTQHTAKMCIRDRGVECSEDTVKDGTYKIQRPFVFVTNKSVTLSEQAQAFVDFATSKDAADLIRTAGAVPVNE